MSFLTILGNLLIGPLKLVFENILSIANRLLGHPGLAIVFLSLAVNFLVLPLYRRADAIQKASQEVEARLHDGVVHIKKVFSGDERMMILQTYYRQNNYKPTDALNGSVSLLLQIPFFMAAYQTLIDLEMFDEVSFGPIADLGEVDGLLVIGALTINLLPILMTLINVVSGAIYSRGAPRKVKVQLYVMAAFFLVFLYNCPSCLVLYWTLNNLFSLVKNLFSRLKHPKKVLLILCSCTGLGALLFGIFLYHPLSVRRKLLVIGIGVLLQVPLLWTWLQARLPLSKKEDQAAPNKAFFLLGCVFLTLLTGLLIPSAYIAASPQEFVDISYFHHPGWYLVSSLSLSAGTFLVWMGVFYWLASPRGKVLFQRILWVLCGILFVNYMFFGKNLGIISAALKYEQEFGFAMAEQLINLAVIGVLACALYFLSRKFPRVMPSVLLTAVIALGGMSLMNTATIFRSVDSGNLQQNTSSAEEDVPQLPLSKTGKNVVVIMLDRALGHTVPYIMEEKPELKEQFAGFTYYDNTISFGYYTNFGAPPLVGGYEYTPVEMNRRSQEHMVDKHNEALKVMPVMFLKEGFQVTVCDPPYANYRWIPDLSIYDDYPEIRTYNTEGIFSDDFQKQQQINNNYRNFFCFSIMKCMPLCVQSTIYCNGTYNQTFKLNQDGFQTQAAQSMSVAEGIRASFMDSYNTLLNLPTMTRVTEDASNTFLFLNNDITHDPMLLQAPGYVPSYQVDNTQYDASHTQRFTLNGRTLSMDNSYRMMHYHANMAALLQIGNWLDYLRDQGVYDNTRIILVADHGNDMNQLEALTSVNGETVEGFFPLLMVKDFGSTEYTVSSEFMTNADVPTLASAELIENPVNPFTGKPITSEEKTAHEQYILISSKINLSENNGTTFLPDRWASVKDNIWEKDNWTFYEGESVFPEPLN